MKNITVFLSENFKFLEEKFSIYLNRHVFVMSACGALVQGLSPVQSPMFIQLRIELH